jgi:hypothetical protein
LRLSCEFILSHGNDITAGRFHPVLFCISGAVCFAATIIVMLFVLPISLTDMHHLPK